MTYDELAKLVYDNINPVVNEYLTVPRTDKGRRVSWNRLDTHIRAFYTEITKTVLDATTEEVA